MPRLNPILFGLALLAPSMALGQAPSPPAADFRTLWTGWNGASRQSIEAESEALRRLREELATAEAARLRQLRDEGRDLGTRVGEIVSLGDCEDGERIARAAGDFALVEAVRSYCRQTEDSGQTPSR